MYASATDKSLLPKFLEEYSEVIGASSGTVIVLSDVRTGAGHIFCSARTEQRYSELYEQCYSRQNVYVEALRRRGARFLVAPGEELCPDHDLVRTEYYNDYLRPQRVRFSLGMVYVSDEVHAHLGATRPEAAGPFGLEETQMASWLGPHFARAMALYHRFYRLLHRCEELEELAERLSFGVIWLNVKGTVSDANRNGARLLASGDGIRAEKGVLYAATQAESKRLHRLIAEAIDSNSAPAAGSMRITRRSTTRPYAVTVAPVRAAEARHAAMVMIVDPAQPCSVSLRRLIDLFSLTPTEAQVCAFLAEGLSVAEIAAALNITVGTARLHLKHVFDKTDTGRQADLVHLLLSCCGWTDAEPPAHIGPSDLDRGTPR
jgi:DNA-binding CsgD family transcriptional regulator